LFAYLKCLELIYIEGFARSGKTTIAREVMLYLISQDLKSIGKFSKFNVIYLDMHVYSAQEPKTDFRTWLLETIIDDVLPPNFSTGSIVQVQKLFHKQFADPHLILLSWIISNC